MIVEPYYMEFLSPDLKNLVRAAVSQFGLVVRREVGETRYHRIEKIRRDMALLRHSPRASFSAPGHQKSFVRLQNLYSELQGLTKDEQHEIAGAFTLMLELMNACENAYRSHRLDLKTHGLDSQSKKPKAVVYVLTAHPTEARSPQNIAVFHAIQEHLKNILLRHETQQSGGRDKTSGRTGKGLTLTANEKQRLFHLLAVAWHTQIVRKRAPRVKDEAEHIYSLILRDEVLLALLDMDSAQVPLFLRTWVGGDKDGHPGVNHKVMLQSLTLSRQKLLAVFQQQLSLLQTTLTSSGTAELRRHFVKIKHALKPLRNLKHGDASHLHSLRLNLKDFIAAYNSHYGAPHPALLHLTKLLQIFPALVIPLELRESSDVLMSEPLSRPVLAIDQMLKLLGSVSKGGDPRWYVRGFIVSMTQKPEHLYMALNRQKVFLKDRLIPVIPLFEDAVALKDAEKIMTAVFAHRGFSQAAKKDWNRMVEMMVGYSDSSKESGALYSRVSIAYALPRLEAVCKRHGYTSVFFHGSGGSIDRGGGSIDDQIAWWPKTALDRYKVTLQGEMIDRSLATPSIARRQIEKIIEYASLGLQKKKSQPPSDALRKFAQSVADKYRQQIVSQDFLRVSEKATPYSYLSLLRIGSRPSKRAGTLSVKSLRAIPWVLCWTQTRVLFQTWWGLGSAWAECTAKEKQALKREFKETAVFRSYIKALGFTLAKIELPVWRLYLQNSVLSADEIDSTYQAFVDEYRLTLRAFTEISAEEHLLWFRPWLGESIHLRAPNIHPLNVLQILAQQNRDADLLRVTVTGISSGMLTTG